MYGNGKAKYFEGSFWLTKLTLGKDLVEMFEERPITFSDKKLIADEFKNTYIKVRLGRLADVIFLVVLLLSFVFKIESKMATIISAAVLIYIGSLIATILELRREFKSQIKYVGDFHIINKQSSRMGHSLETRGEYIKVARVFYEKVKVGDRVQIEKLGNNRVFKVELI